uniref:Uncharacterized protein n=1 Tax=Tanacetum cinerariifolium TaxID=118510 RepID=A0A6L2MGH4_TANCI|nr:hypothetical protein [Tanacetum cinerariifolium]
MVNFCQRSEKHVPNLLPEVMTCIEGCHELFFYVQDFIIPVKYSQLLSQQNKLDSKSFKDKLPLNIEENPMFQRLVQYPTSVCIFPDPIIFLARLKPLWEYEMAFRNFIYIEDVEDLLFLPKEPSPGFSTGSPSILVNTKPLKADKELVIRLAEVTIDSRESLKPKLFVVHRGSVAARIKDRKCKTRGGSSRPHNHLDNHMDVEFLDPHDRCYTRQAVVDNDRKRAREEECEELRAKCKAVITEFEKNPTVVALQEKISTLSTEVKEHKVTYLEAEKASLEAVEVSLRKEVKEIKHDRREVVLKFILYAAIELIHLIRLVSSLILYRRCRAYEQVVDMKEPFDLSKVKGYRSFYKKDHTQASNDVATITFPWLDECVADPPAPIEALLSKKAPSLQRPSPSRNQVSFPSS